jgi:acyl carrier protein
MSSGPAWDRVSAFLSAEFEVPADAIRPEARLIEDLGLDSLDLVDMVVEMESTLGRRITNDELKAIRTVGGVVGLLEAGSVTPRG